MTLETLTQFFAWTSLIHVLMLLLVTIVLVMARDWVASVHARMFSIDAQALPKIYFAYLAAYKIGVLIFALVPYLVLRFAIS